MVVPWRSTRWVLTLGRRQVPRPILQRESLCSTGPTGTASCNGPWRSTRPVLDSALTHIAPVIPPVSLECAAQGVPPNYLWLLTMRLFYRSMLVNHPQVACLACRLALIMVPLRYLSLPLRKFKIIRPLGRGMQRPLSPT